MSENGIKDLLLAPFRAIWSMTFGEQRGDWVAEQGPLKLTLAVVFFPLVLLFQFIVFIFLSWTISRNGKKFMLGMPAVTMFALALAALVIFQYFSYAVRNRYRAEFNVAFKAENYDLASLWCQKILSFDRFDPEYRYQNAVIRSEQKGVLQALGGMQELAPLLDEQLVERLSTGKADEDEDDADLGNMEAHLWCGRFFMGKASENLVVDSKPLTEDERLKIARRHFDIIVLHLQEENNVTLLNDFDPKVLTIQVETYSRLGIIYEKKKQFFAAQKESANNEDDKNKFAASEEDCFKNAISSYQQAARFNTLIFPSIVRLCKDYYGIDSDAFKRRLELAVTNIQRETLRRPNSFPVWNSLVQCLVIGGKYVEAENELTRSRTLVTNPEVSRRLQSLRAELFVHAVDNFRYTGPEKQRFLAKITWLTRSLRIKANNRSAIVKLNDLLRAPKGPLSDDQIDWLRDFSLDNSTPFLANLMLGLDSAFRSFDNVDDANKYKRDAMLQWQLAISQYPGATEILTAAADFLSIQPEVLSNEDLDKQPKIDQASLTPSGTENSDAKDKKVDAKDSSNQKQEPKDKGKQDSKQQDQVDAPKVDEVVLTEYQKKNTETAIRLMDLAVEMNSAEVRFLEMRGILLYRMQRYESAFDDLETALEINKKRPRVLAGLVAVAEKLGKEKELKLYREKLDAMIQEINKQREIMGFNTNKKK